jgi:hypothetical protein
MKTRWFLIASLAAIGAAGCAPEMPEISQKPLFGNFNGRYWGFVSGGTELFSPDANKYLSTLRDIEADACDVESGDEALVVNIPYKPGKYRLEENNLTVTFRSDGEEYVTSDGVIDVHEVTPAVIRAGIYAYYDGDPYFEVTGQFTVDICDVK